MASVKVRVMCATCKGQQVAAVQVGGGGGGRKKAAGQRPFAWETIQICDVKDEEVNINSSKVYLEGNIIVINKRDIKHSYLNNIKHN